MFQRAFSVYAGEAARSTPFADSSRARVTANASPKACGRIAAACVRLSIVRARGEGPFSFTSVELRLHPP